MVWEGDMGRRFKRDTHIKKATLQVQEHALKIRLRENYAYKKASFTFPQYRLSLNFQLQLDPKY